MIVHHKISDFYKSLGWPIEQNLDFTIHFLPDIHITLTEAFLRENVHPDIFRECPFLLTEIIPPKTMAEKEYKEFEDIYLIIFKEFNKSSGYKKQILGNLFVVLLLKIKEKFWHDYDAIEEGDRNSRIVRSFKQSFFPKSI